RLLRAWIDQGMAWDAGVTFARPEPANLKPHAPATVAADDPAALDRILDAYFPTTGTPPPEVVDDRVFARRAFLDVIGLPPSPEQLKAFLDDPSPDKRPRLVRRLLSDRRGYAD